MPDAGRSQAGAPRETLSDRFDRHAGPVAIGVVLLWTLALVFGHPVTIALGFHLRFEHPTPVAHMSNTTEMSDAVTTTWLLRSFAACGLLTILKLGALWLIEPCAARIARVHALSQLPFVLLLPVAFMLPGPIEGNILGFFVFPYMLLAGSVATLVSGTITLLHVVAAVRRRMTGTRD